MATLRELLAEPDESKASRQTLTWVLKHANMRSGATTPLKAVATTNPSALMWRILGILAIYPRYVDLCESVRAFLVDIAGDVPWRAAVARHATTRSCSFAFSGSSVRVDPETTQYLKVALLEHAMLGAQRWSHAVWREHVVPAFANIRVVWGAWDDDGRLMSASRDPGAVEGQWVGVPHPLELSPEEVLALCPQDLEEPFEQMGRWHDRTEPEPRRRLDRGVFGLEVEDVRLFGKLRRQGWRRGEIMDFPAFTEMFMQWQGRGDVRPFVRFLPGIRPNGPGPEATACHILVCGYANKNTRPPWGHYWDSDDDLLVGDVSQSDLDKADHRVGLELAAVDPVVRSETRRTLRLLTRAERLLPYSGRASSPVYEAYVRGEHLEAYDACMGGGVDPQTKRAVAEALADAMWMSVQELRKRWQRLGIKLSPHLPHRPGRVFAYSGHAAGAKAGCLEALAPVLAKMDFHPTNKKAWPERWPPADELDPLFLMGNTMFLMRQVVFRTPSGSPSLEKRFDVETDALFDPLMYHQQTPWLLPSGRPARLVVWLRQVILEQGGMGATGVMPDVCPDLLDELTEGLPRF